MRTPRIEAVIFDAEGVVIDTEPAWDRCQTKFFKRHGIHYEREKVKPMLTGRSTEEGTRLLQGAFGIKGDVKQLADERFRLFLAELGTVSHVDGFLPFYQRISAKYRTCVASAARPELLRIADEVLGLRKLFDGKIYSVADVNSVSKPDPALFLFAAKQLRIEPAACAVIEDSPLGIVAAQRAKMFSIGIATTYASELLSGANLVVRSFAEIDVL